MKAQFNLINKPNQSIKLSVNLRIKNSNKKGLSEYSYNKVKIFNYSIMLNNSHVVVDIYTKVSLDNHFNKTVIGSFIYDTSLKYSASEITVIAENKLDLETCVYGFLKKDFIYSIYKKNSKKSNYKTNFKLTKKYLCLLNSINFLKELVTEPSNIIYPISFVKRTLSQLDKKSIHIKTLNKEKLKKIGLNCLLAVSQGSKREPMVMEFVKKSTKKNALIVVGYQSNQVVVWRI